MKSINTRMLVLFISLHKEQLRRDNKCQEERNNLKKT